MTIKGYDIILVMNFENEILLRGGGCEDPKIFIIILFYCLINYLLNRFLRIIYLNHF